MKEASGAPELMSPEQHASLVQFAKACRAAARAVSLYPPAHPAIGIGLEQLVAVSSAVTRDGPFELRILPDGLLLNGAAPIRVDTGIAELAALLYRQSVGRLVLHGGSDAESWRALLLLLARPPEELRADGGIGTVWRRAGGPSLEIEQIDFSDVLREHAGGEADLLTILRHCLHGGPDAPASSLEARQLQQAAQTPAEFRALVRERLIERSRQASGAGFLDLARSLVAKAAGESPERLEAMLDSLCGMAGSLPPDLMIDLLKRRGTDAALVGQPGHAVDVATAIADRMPDATLAEFVANAVASEGRATSTLATAFQELVSEPDRQDRVLELAADRLSEAGAGEPEGPVDRLWEQARAMLTAATSEKYVSDEYARELRRARTRAMAVEDTQDDPPERIADWIDTVSDRAIRTLDVQLILDLLQIEESAPRWSAVLDTATWYIDDLVRVNQLEGAADLADAIAAAAAEGGDPEKRPIALDALKRLSAGPVVRHMANSARNASEEHALIVRRLCLALGPPVITPLVQALTFETDPKHRRRLHDLIVLFGAPGREIVQGLVSAEDADVRRTAVYLLREFAVGGTLPDLEPLLTDAEPRVQREAIRTIALAGDERAYGVLAHALRTRAGARDLQIEELSALTDERAAALFLYLVLHLDPRSAPLPVCVLALNALGRFGGHHAVEALQKALFSGAWWQPFRAAAIRAAAADALRAIGSPPALDVLRTAARRAGGARRAAKRALER